MPIPINWEDNDTYVTVDVDSWTGCNNKDRTMTGMVFPFWGSEVYAEDTTYPFLTFFEEQGMSYGIASAQVWNITRVPFLTTLAKAYLPIRLVRNAYDYSVEKIEPVTN